MAMSMQLERGRSANPFEIVRQDFNDMLGRVLGRGLLRNGSETDPLALLTNFGVDIREDPNHVYVEADLPGFRKEDVEVTLENGTLTISAGRREVGEGPERQANQTGQLQQNQSEAQTRPAPNSADYLLRERRYQRFLRSFTLPTSVEEQNVQARLEDGVLKITLNKREETKPKRIAIS